ncbi:cation:proton antiporter [Egbenema bharatensis]|uniref:cation:proton antiporter n=1 Tax=Egbenema bharatensis TaxID=3463334 RepID=UPI003A8B10CA
MDILTVVWITLPFFVGFLIYLLPTLDRFLAMGVALVSLAYGLWQLIEPSSVTLSLLDSFGVTLTVDVLSGYFILTNALVTTAVLLYCWGSNKTAFFYTQAIVLHGSINAVFICADFISLYVALEVIGIAAFLLITYPRSDRSIWLGLRYLFVSNVAMLFYLVGVAMVYQMNHSFAFAGLRNAPAEATTLIFLGLLTKGGVFISGLWTPLTNAESETAISALLSGVVEKAGVFPLIRLALLLDQINPIVRFFAVASALMGVTWAILEKDTKRTLAFSTISQLGWVMAAPAVGGVYALAHGLAKPAIFLAVGHLPSRDFKELQKQRIDTTLWMILLIGGLSIAGFPLLAGFGAKILTMQNLVPWQTVLMDIAAIGTVIVYAKFVFLPHQKQKMRDSLQPGFWAAIALLIGGLLVANGVYYPAYTVANITKAIALVGIGWLIYHLMIRRISLQLPRMFEQLEHLIGMMSVMLVLLFWMVWA